MQGAVGFFLYRLTTNFPMNLSVKKLFTRLRFGRIMVTTLWPTFLAHPVVPIPVSGSRTEEWREGWCEGRRAVKD